MIAIRLPFYFLFYWFICNKIKIDPYNDYSYRKQPSTKAFDEAILQNICSWGNGLLENRRCSYKVLTTPSWKILCVLTKFWTRSPGKFWSVLYDISSSWKMCSCVILRKLSWKFWCVHSIFCLSWKIYVFLYNFWFSQKIWCVLYKRIMSSPGKLEMFLLHPTV